MIRWWFHGDLAVNNFCLETKHVFSSDTSNQTRSIPGLTLYWLQVFTKWDDWRFCSSEAVNGRGIFQNKLETTIEVPTRVSSWSTSHEKIRIFDSLKCAVRWSILVMYFFLLLKRPTDLIECFLNMGGSQSHLFSHQKVNGLDHFGGTISKEDTFNFRQLGLSKPKT